VKIYTDSQECGDAVVKFRNECLLKLKYKSYKLADRDGYVIACVVPIVVDYDDYGRPVVREIVKHFM
jgi:hypothetical protein